MLDDDDDYDDDEDDGCNNHNDDNNNDATTIMMDFFDHEPSIREKIEVGPWNQEPCFLQIACCCYNAQRRAVWYTSKYRKVTFHWTTFT